MSHPLKNTSAPTPTPKKVEPQLREHKPTKETKLKATGRALVGGQAAATQDTAMTFGQDFELPLDVGLLVLSHLPRSDLGSVALVCRDWEVVSLITRSIKPACAADVAVKLRLLGETTDNADGEYDIYPQGKYNIPPIKLYCHNVLSSRPTEFVTLNNDDNWSFFPATGCARGTSIRTRFQKLRINPHTLTIKTDDFTFAESEGKLEQTYWNGQRRVTFTEVPFATARDGGLNRRTGTGSSSIDLSGTGLCVDVRGFRAMGCGAWGLVLLPRCPVDEGTQSKSVGQLETIQNRAVSQTLGLFGGGYAGRFSPIRDVTLDEKARGGNYDNEGRSGGWVLPLHRCAEVDGSEELFTSSETSKGSVVRASDCLELSSTTTDCWAIRGTTWSRNEVPV